MATNNFYNVVNATGAALTAEIDGTTVNVPVNESTMSGKHAFAAGDGDIPATIGTQSVTIKNLPGGVNSWSTLVFTSNGYVNIFPSRSNQGAVPA
jgi:hypothetical protein